MPKAIRRRKLHTWLMLTATLLLALAACASPFRGVEGAPPADGDPVALDAAAEGGGDASVALEAGPVEAGLDASVDAWAPKGLRLTRGLRGDEVGEAVAECAALVRNGTFVPWLWTGQANPGAGLPSGGYWNAEGGFGFATRPGSPGAVIGSPPTVWVGMLLDGGAGATCEDWKTGSVLGSGAATDFKSDLSRTCATRLPVLCVEK